MAEVRVATIFPKSPASHEYRTLRRARQLAVIFAAYLVAGELGLAVPFTSGNVSPFWPPAGIALGSVLLFGSRAWPAIALAAFVVNFFTPTPHLAAAGIAVGNTLGPLCAAWLLRRRDFHPSLARLRDVVALSTLGALGAAVSATVGALVLLVQGVSAWSGFASTWLIWWLGDAMGVLIVTPVILTLADRSVAVDRRRIVEGTCLVLGAAVSALLIFEPRLEVMNAQAFGFAVVPFVLWGAIRFESRGAAVVSFVISCIAVWGTAHGFGPFFNGTAVENATLLESFLGVTSASGLMLAAAVGERERLIRQQTERKALERSEKNYRDIVETAYEGIWKTDEHFITSFVNSRMAELLGYSPGEMVGRPLFDFLFEADLERKRADLERRREGVSEHLEGRYRRKDGSVLWARVATSAIKGDDGRFQGALAMVSDITEQKRAEEEASRSRERIDLLSRAVDQTADSVVIADRNGTIEYVNPSFEATTGYSRAEAIGRTPRILRSGFHDEAFYSKLWQTIVHGEVFRGTLVNRKKSGELYWAEQTISPITDPAGDITHFVSVLKNITESRKQQEQEVQLRLAREVQQRFYAGAAVSFPGFDIATVAHPAVETGGDYLDMVSLPGGRVCIGIGDVSGHGLSSALVMALTRAYVRAFARTETDLAKILCSVNEMLCADLEDNRFVTLLLVCLDPSNGCLSYASAGHIPGFLLDSSGETRWVLESSGPPLGVFGGSRFCMSRIPLAPQQLVVLMTDGITEMTSSDDEEFGTEGVLDYVRAHARDSARDLAEGLYRAGRSYAGDRPQVDDVTEAIIRVS